MRVSVKGVPDVQVGDKLGMELMEVESNAVNRISGSEAFYYFNEVPDEVVIDGAFGDWDELHGASEEDIPDRIDIQHYGMKNHADEAYFTLKTRDDILKGTAIPEGVERYEEELIAQDIGGDGEWDYVNPEWDTTRDGIPDTGWMDGNGSIDVYVEMEIPTDTGNVTDGTQLQVGSYYSDAYDEASDVTYVSEFQFTAFFMVIVFVLVLNLLFIRYNISDKASKN
ncbi:MAG: hypothetical protein ACOC53_00650 [Candidatus Saliniplasma sp.]